MWDAFWNVPQESPGLAFGPSHGHMVVFAFHPLDRPGKHERKGARLWKGLRGKERGVVRTVRKRLHVPALGAALHRPCGWLRTAHVRVCVCVCLCTRTVLTPFSPAGSSLPSSVVPQPFGQLTQSFRVVYCLSSSGGPVPEKVDPVSMSWCVMATSVK